MQARIVDLETDAATRALGAALAARLRPGDVIALHGGLGAGKTTLARGLIQALCGGDEAVPSPTFTLVQMYDGPDFPVWHFDLYRIDAPDDVRELGLDETGTGAALIEWPELAGRYLPGDRLDVRLDFAGEHRRATLEATGEGWQERLHDI